MMVVKGISKSFFFTFLTLLIIVSSSESFPIRHDSTNPPTSTLPISNPVTTPITVPGTQPATNPVATNPAPAGAQPTNPVTSTGVGQSWCVAKTGAQQTALQQALDYACGIGRADCAAIQPGGSCYNPNSLQNHASFAFNSYYQKNPSGPSSCDFGGTAMTTTSNPSSGSCVYTTSSSAPSTKYPPPPAVPSSPPATTSTPTTTFPPPATTFPPPVITSAPPVKTLPPPAITSPPAPVTSLPGAAVPGFCSSISPPTLLNMSNPDSGTPIVFGDNPPSFNSSTSLSISLQPFIRDIVLVAFIIKIKLILDM